MSSGEDEQSATGGRRTSDGREGAETSGPGEMLRVALRSAVAETQASIVLAEDSARRREAVRATRRALKDVRALATLCRPRDAVGQMGPHASSTDGVVEFAAKANQLLGPLRDRDALVRSIQRLAERFADGEPRRVVRTVLLATLVYAEHDRVESDAWSQGSLDRARRAIGAMAVAAQSSECLMFDEHHAARTLIETHRRAVLTLRDALDANDAGSGDLARLHDGRKLASFLALTLKSFGDDVPADARRVRVRARRLASALGEDRDLALLDVEMARVRTQLGGSALAVSIDGALRLARLEASARMEDAARSFLRLRRGRVARAIEQLFGAD
ncbi:MAG: hypothetical protein ACKO3W_03690 [bacterium]